jgi:3-dehydroquinate dehydratase
MDIRMLRTISSAILLAAAAGTMTSVAIADRAQAAACPFVLMQSCVAEKDKFMHTAWTNSCLAKGQGLHILYKGACKGGH